MAFECMPPPGEIIQLGDFLLENRRFSAVYFLYWNGSVVYVGQSKTLSARINQHLDDAAKVFDAVSFIRCTIDRLYEIEGCYIKQLKPKYNKCNVARKARERESWGRNKYWVAAKDIDPRNMKLAETSCEGLIIPPQDIGEFLLVCESDVEAWVKAGKIKDHSVMGLLNFVVNNPREFSQALDRFEQL